RNSSTSSTPGSRARGGDCSWNSTSKPGCAGANSPNYVCATSTWPPGMLTVARAVVEINARFREADAPRFWVKDYPKDKEYRRVKLSPEITATLAEHITTHDLGRDDLL